MLRLLFIFSFLFPTLSWGQPALRFLYSIDNDSLGNSFFKKPAAISCDVQGNLYVVDAASHRLFKFNNRGDLVSFVGGFGWGTRQFHYPSDVFVYNSLDVFVADYENHRIERYDKDLNWIATYACDSNLPSHFQFLFPRAVCLSLHGDIFIADAEYDRVLKMNPRFEPELSFGDFDWGRGKLSAPSSIAIDDQDRIYVADESAGVVKVFDYFGNYLFGIGFSTLSKPVGLSFDPSGRLFVADCSLHQIFIFAKSGEKISSFGTRGDQIGSFNEPYDVAVSGRRLFVADTGNRRIQVFELDWDR